METTLQAEVRKSRGKGPARRLRAEGKVPGILYGKDVTPTALAVSPKDLEKALKGEKGRNQVFTIALGDRKDQVMVRDLEVHPVTREIVHVDFYRVVPDQVVEAVVPVVSKGRAIGVQKGAKLGMPFRSLPVRCTPAAIPVKIEIDVSNLDIGDHLTVADIPMPEGVTITLRPQQTVASVFEEKIIEETPAPGAPGAAAPAAGAAPAAAPAAAAPAAKAPAKK